MPSITVPVNGPVTRPDGRANRTNYYGQATAQPTGSYNGVPVTDAQVTFDGDIYTQYGGARSGGRIEHHSQFRYNRYTKGWVDFDKMRAMRRDPTIALAREAAVAPIIGASWVVELVDNNTPERIKYAVEKYLLKFRTAYLRTALFGEIDYGWRPYEKVLNIKSDSKLGTVVFPNRTKPLLVDNTWLAYDDEGDFDGLVHRDPNDGQWYLIDSGHSLAANFDDDGVGNYQDPRLMRAEAAYDEWNDCNAAAKRFDNKIAGALWVVHYPQGYQPYYKGQTNVDNHDVALDIIRQIKASGFLVVPSKLLTAAEQELAELGQDGWRIELIESSDKQASFTTRLDYLDKQKVRALGILERAIMEGNYGTKAEAESHINLMLLNMYLKHVDLTEYYNQMVVDQFTAINFNMTGIVKFVAQPLADATRDLYVALFQSLLASPIAGDQIADKLDISELMRSLKVPELSEQEIQQRDKSLLGMFKQVNQTINTEN